MRRAWALPFGAKLVAVTVVVLAVAAPVTARAQDDGDGTGDTPPEATPGEQRLVVVPSGCVVPVPPDVVFTGTLVDRDFRTARFQVEQVRAGDVTPFAGDGMIDVRYGFDVDYLELGAEYLVAARRDPVLGVLASKIREDVPRFGGDAVIGMAETDVECPPVEDAIRTLLPDGTSVESGIFAPFFAERTRLAAAFLAPLGIALAVVFILAMLRLSLSGIVRGVGTVARRPR